MPAKKKKITKKKVSKKILSKKPKKKLSKAEKEIVALEAVSAKMKAIGVAVHTKFSDSTPAKYLSEVKEFTDFRYDDRETVIDLSRRLRKYEGICSTVGDLLADFCITDGYFECEDEELEAALNFWYVWVNSIQEDPNYVAKTPGIKEFARKTFDDWLTDGDAVFVDYWGDTKKIKIPKLGGAYRLPTTLKSLDVLNLEVSELLAQVGIEQISMKLSDDVKNALKNPRTDEDKILVKLVPKEWIKYIKARQDILLDPLTVHHLKRNGKDYLPWGEGYFIKAFASVAFKRRIQSLDAATISGLINRITILKLGMADKEKNPAYHIPTSTRLAMLNALVTDPKASNLFIWPGPDLEVLDIGPDGKILDMESKYVQADKDILRALHVSPLLIDGSTGGTASRDWATFISTRVGLEVFRNAFSQEMNRIARRIAELNGKKDIFPTFRFKSQLLNDDKTRKTFLTSLYEFGVISIETMITESGYNFEAEKRKKLQEEKEKLPELFRNKSLPYQGQDIDDGKKKVETKEKKETKEGDEEDEGETKAKIVASIDWLMKDVSQEIEENVSIYSAKLNTIYDSILDSTKDSIEKGEDKDKILTKVAAIFTAFVFIVEGFLKSSFLSKYEGDKIPDNWNLLMTRWNEGYLSNFLKDLQDGVGVALTKDNAQEMVDLLFETQRYRVPLYVSEGSRKAFWLGFLARSEEQGIKGGRWLCQFVNSCGYCMAQHNGIYSITELASSYPPHPACACSIEMLK